MATDEFKFEKLTAVLQSERLRKRVFKFWSVKLQVSLLSDLVLYVQLQSLSPTNSKIKIRPHIYIQNIRKF